MRLVVNLLSGASRSALIAGGGVLFLCAAPSYAQQQDILLQPPPEMPPLEEPVPLEETVAPEEIVEPQVVPDPAAQSAMDDLLKKIDAGAQQVQQPAPSVPQVAPEIVNDQTPLIPTPDETQLTDPASATPADISAPGSETVIVPIENTDSNAAPTTVTEIPAVPPSEVPEENLFFDADSLVPSGEIGSTGPRKVNPALEPASKLIIVKKDYEPSARQAQLVSAERAVKLGHYDAALEMYDALYAKNARDPNILMGRAIALQHLGQHDAAVQAYEALLDLNPDNVEAQVNMLGLMGQSYPAVSLQRLKELRGKQPNNVAIIGQMAVLQANMGQYDEAFKYLGMASSMQPHNANHLFNMAVIADRAGKQEQAVEYYEQALEVDSVYNGGSSIPRDAIYERLARLR